MSAQSNRSKSSFGDVGMNLGIVDTLKELPKKIKDYFSSLFGRGGTSELDFSPEHLIFSTPEKNILETENNYYNYTSIIDDTDKRKKNNSHLRLIEEEKGSQTRLEKPFKRKNKAGSIISDIAKKSEENSLLFDQSLNIQKKEKTNLDQNFLHKKRQTKSLSSSLCSNAELEERGVTSLKGQCYYSFRLKPENKQETLNSNTSKPSFHNNNSELFQKQPDRRLAHELLMNKVNDFLNNAKKLEEKINIKSYLAERQAREKLQNASPDKIKEVEKKRELLGKLEMSTTPSGKFEQHNLKLNLTSVPDQTSSKLDLKLFSTESSAQEEEKPKIGSIFGKNQNFQTFNNLPQTSFFTNRSSETQSNSMPNSFKSGASAISPFSHIPISKEKNIFSVDGFKLLKDNDNSSNKSNPFLSTGKSKNTYANNN